MQTWRTQRGPRGPVEARHLCVIATTRPERGPVRLAGSLRSPARMPHKDMTIKRGKTVHPPTLGGSAPEEARAKA